MRAVSDAGPLIHLSWINQLGLLKQIFDEVVVPPAVRDEVLAAPEDTRGLQVIQHFVDAIGVSVQIPRRPEVTTAELGGVLGAGEGEAIMLAEEISADFLLTDDAPARAEAMRRGLEVVGSVGVLVQAREIGLISAALPLVLELRSLGQWMSDRLIEAVAEAEMTK